MRPILLFLLIGQVIAVASIPSGEAKTAQCARELFALGMAHELSLADRVTVTKALSRFPVEISNFNFTNLWAWHHVRKYVISVRHEVVLVAVNSDPVNTTYLEPFGASPSAKARIIKEMLIASEKADGLPARFAYVSTEVANLLKADPDGQFEIYADPDAADYVYATEDLLRKAGPRYQNYRTELNQFWRSNPNARFVAFREDPRLLRKAIDFNRRWLDGHRYRADPVLVAEVKAADRVLADYFQLDLFGGAIVVDDELIAYGVGETINSDTAVFHFLKGANRARGINSALLDLMVANLPPGTAYINLEEDLGHSGLRMHKLSLNPCKRVEKNVVRLVCSTSLKQTQ